MVQCDKEDAFRSKENAIKMMDNKEFVAARKIVLEAQRLYPELEGILHLLSICDVHCAAEARINNKEMDWYKIFQVEQSADETIIRKQYLKLSRSLHTDKNGFPGAEDAFKLVSEAYSTLHDPIKRKEYDMLVTKKKNDIKECDVIKKKDGIKTNLSTFWTSCPHCHRRYLYNSIALNTSVHCLMCKGNFTAYNLNGQDWKPASSSVSNGSQVPVNKFQFQKHGITPCQRVHHANTSSAGRVTDVKVQMSSPNQDRSSFPADKQPAPTDVSREANIKEKAKTTGKAPMQAAPVQFWTSRWHSSRFVKADLPMDKATNLKRRKLEGAGKTAAAARAVPNSRAPPDSSSGRPSGASA